MLKQLKLVLFFIGLSLRSLGYYFQHPLLLRTDLVLFYYYQLYFPKEQEVAEKEKSKRPFSELVFGETSYASLGHFFKDIPFSKKTKFVDLGCGKGHLCFFVAKHYGIPVTGVDVISTYIQTASRVAERFKVGNLEFSELDFMTSEFPKGSIYYVVTKFFPEYSRAIIARKFDAIPRKCFILTAGHTLEFESFRLVKSDWVRFSWGFDRLHLYKNF